MRALETIQTPAYVADVAAIKHNLEVAKQLKSETGCTLLLATKACSMFSLFPLFAEVLDGTTASGYYEAKLGHDHFGGQVHAYSPAYTDSEFEQLLPIAEHLYFNSISQLKHFAPHASDAKIGLRLNPQFSQVTNASIYDPSAKDSRFGVELNELTQDVLTQIDILHVHNLCENLAGDSAALIDWLIEHAAHALAQVSAVNLGGGHYVTHSDYAVGTLITTINKLKARFDVEVILESGGAWVYNAGYLVTRVLDIIDRDRPIAVLDTSATCHMPDVLEMPYRPNIIGEDASHTHAYLLTGRTCLTGDVIGEYRFAQPLEIGQTLIFTDMLQYSMVKNTTFNGMPLPDIGVLEEDGSYRVVKAFGYEDFEKRLS